MSFRHPPPHDDGESGSEQTQVQTGRAGSPALPGLSYVLERGVDSQGSPPLAFTGGQQQGPISLGRGGQFRIDGRGVLAMHGYLMFDGEGIYLCSADETSPILADSARVPREWTRVGVPCTLVFGRTRAVLRAAATAAPPKPLPAKPVPAPPNPRPARQTGPPPRASYVPPPQNHLPPDAPTPYEGVPAAIGASEGRPRVTSQSDDESTRLGPDLLARSGSLAALSGDDESTRMNTDLPRGAPPPQRPAAPHAQKEIQPYVPPRPPGMVPQPAPAPVAPVAYAPAGYAPPEPPPAAYAPGHPPAPTYVTAPQPPGPPAPPPPAAPPMAATNTVPTKATRVPFRRRLDALKASVQPGSPHRTPVLLGGLSLVAIFVMSVVTFIRISASRPANPGPPRPPPPPAVVEPLAAATATSPGIVVYPAPPPRPEADAGLDAARPPRGKPAPPPPPTLERNAVDAYNRGDVPGALALYRQLAQKQPDNPAFANAVRILQQRLGPASGAP